MQKDKRNLRIAMLDQLKQLDGQVRQNWEENLKIQLIDYIKEMDYQNIALYYSFFPEIDVLPMIKAVETLNRNIFLPCLAAHYQLEFAPYHTGDSMRTVFREVKQPLTEQRLDPSQLDLIVVPGVIFTSKGDRIGFGGGYYDRLLAKFPSAMTISLVFPLQIVSENSWSIERHDLPIKKLIIAK